MSQITFSNSGDNAVNSETPQPVVDTWTIPGGTRSFTNTYRRVGNKTGHRVHWCMTLASFGVGAATGIISSPVGSIPSRFRPSSPVGYIVLSGSGDSGGATQTLRILVLNTGQIFISRGTGGNMTGNITVGGWDLSWDTVIPDL